MKRTLLALCLSLALASPVAFALTPASASAPPAPAAWVDASNTHTLWLLQQQAPFGAEGASGIGLSEYDGQVTDLGPRVTERYREAMEKALVELRARQAAEKDENVRQDLAILVASVEQDLAGQALGEKYELPWFDVPVLVYSGMQGLLQEQMPEARRAKALERLQRYVGLSPGSTPITELAKARYAERAGNAQLIGPVRAEVEQSLANVPTYIAGIRALFAEFKIEGADPALKAMEQQLTDYAAWAKTTVLPRAREDFRLPAELYAHRLRVFGVDVAPEALAADARVGFMETRAAMQALAPQIAKARGFADADYRAVMRALKRETIPNERLEATYAEVNGKLEDAIRAHRVVDLPNRPMIMRLASAAESARQPAPHMDPPALINNTGEQGQFVLPIGNPTAAGAEAYDDFNHPSVTWTLSAHEGRPGHELQFTAMVERGVSQARSLYAFNSVNVEGWALYAEAEMLPYEPIEGQLFALQFRLLRAARAMLDPMLNLGLISREEAGRVLREDVVLSEAMIKQELDRYTFRAPGQAGSYFYGYSRILQLRAEAEVALGAKFDRLAFNNFLLDQGLLPPDLLAKAVREQFIPAQRAR